MLYLFLEIVLTCWTSWKNSRARGVELDVMAAALLTVLALDFGTTFGHWNPPQPHGEPAVYLEEAIVRKVGMDMELQCDQTHQNRVHEPTPFPKHLVEWINSALGPPWGYGRRQSQSICSTVTWRNWSSFGCLDGWDINGSLVGFTVMGYQGILEARSWRSSSSGTYMGRCFQGSWTFRMIQIEQLEDEMHGMLLEAEFSFWYLGMATQWRLVKGCPAQMWLFEHRVFIVSRHLPLVFIHSHEIWSIWYIDRLNHIDLSDPQFGG